MKHYFKIIPAAYLFLIKDNQVLLLQRSNTGYEDGNWSVPAGHLDGDEAASTAAVREAKEEIGLDINPADLKIVHIMHRKGLVPPGKDNERIDFFFVLEQWEGESVNCEPHKCAALTWFPLDALPDNTIPCVKVALDGYKSGTFYSEQGW